MSRNIATQPQGRIEPPAAERRASNCSGNRDSYPPVPDRGGVGAVAKLPPEGATVGGYLPIFIGLGADADEAAEAGIGAIPNTILR